MNQPVRGSLHQGRLVGNARRAGALARVAWPKNAPGAWGGCRHRCGPPSELAPDDDVYEVKVDADEIAVT